MTEFIDTKPAPWGRKRKKIQARADAVSDNRHFPCNNCGADLRYHPGESKLVCTHCDAKQDVPHIDDAAAQVEHSYLDHLKHDGKMAEIEVQSLNCNTCGASVEFNPDEHSRLCPFCDSAIVADVSTQRKIVPQGLLPFSVMERQAHDHMKAWLTSRWFAPNGFEAEAAKEHFNGIYVPIWTYDAGTTTTYKGERGRRVRSGKRSYTQWTKVSGTVRQGFDDVLVSGTQSVSAEFKDALGPWPMRELETYQTEFLAGLRAENHTIGMADGFYEAQQYMRMRITIAIRHDIGGSRQRIHSSQTDFGNLTFKHLLLPVWITHYSLGSKRYRLNVNGRTGKVYGERPFSKLKLLGASFVGTLAAMAIGLIISLASGGY